MINESYCSSYMRLNTMGDAKVKDTVQKALKPGKLKDALGKMLDYDPAKRPTFNEVLIFFDKQPILSSADAANQ